MTVRWWRKYSKHNIPGSIPAPSTLGMLCSLFALPCSVRTLKSCEQIWRSPPRHGPARQVKGGAEGTPEDHSNHYHCDERRKYTLHQGRLPAFWLETGETLIRPIPGLQSIVGLLH